LEIGAVASHTVLTASIDTGLFIARSDGRICHVVPNDPSSHASRRRDVIGMPTLRSRDAVCDVESDVKSDAIGTVSDAGWYAIRMVA
jgi:hypothetical protein